MFLYACIRCFRLHIVAMSLYEEWSKICVAFFEAIKMHMPELLQKQKTHLILHLVDCMRELGPSSAFSAERYIHFKKLALWFALKCKYV